MNFSKIASFPGSGNSYSDKTYMYYDTHPLRGNNYYRLRQVDFDGTETISKITSCAFNSIGKKYKLKVLTLLGTLIYQENDIEEPFQAKVNSLDIPTGVYFIQVLDDKGEEFVYKVYKVN